MGILKDKSPTCGKQVAPGFKTEKLILSQDAGQIICSSVYQH